MNTDNIHYFLNLNFIMQNQSSNAKVTNKPLKSFNGEKFSKLTVIRDCGYAYFPKSRPKRRVLCKCECGKEKELTLADVKSGRITSCGCVLSETTKKRMTKHGMRNTRFYQIYLGVKKRCEDTNNKEYHNYGGRGIKSEFISFEHFKDTMFSTYSDDLTIERKDVYGNYSPSNCEWIPMNQQNWNKRGSIKYNGIPLMKYCQENNLKYSLVKARIFRGWSIEKSISLQHNDHILKIDFKGQTYKLKELCEKQGITPKIYYGRKKNGITGDDLFKPKECK